MSTSKHSPVPLTAYVNSHRGSLAAWLDFFVLHDGVDFERENDGSVTARGVVACAGNLRVHVWQRLRVVNERGWVQASRYAFQAERIAEGTVRPVLRYDNAHSYPGHRDTHHRHRFDDDGKPIRVEWVGEAGWPTLVDVIEELYEQYIAASDPIR